MHKLFSQENTSQPWTTFLYLCNLSWQLIFQIFLSRLKGWNFNLACLLCFQVLFFSCFVLELTSYVLRFNFHFRTLISCVCFVVWIWSDGFPSRIQVKNRIIWWRVSDRSSKSYKCNTIITCCFRRKLVYIKWGVLSSW